MDQITKVDNSTYTTTSQSVISYSVDDDKNQLEIFQGQLDTANATVTTIQANIQMIKDRLTAASTKGVSDATLVLQDQSNQAQG